MYSAIWKLPRSCRSVTVKICYSKWITTLATAVSESAETIEEVYEPFLIQQGFIVRTPRGRAVTEFAYRHLGINKPTDQQGLFGA